MVLLLTHRTILHLVINKYNKQAIQKKELSGLHIYWGIFDWHMIVLQTNMSHNFVKKHFTNPKKYDTMHL